MIALLAGIDFSSIAIDAALIPLDPADTSVPPVEFRRFELPAFKPKTTTSQYRSVERCRAVRRATADFWAASLYGYDTFLSTTCVWIEEPFGHSQNVMRELYGAILASIPPHIAVSTITPAQWRKHHGIDNEKHTSVAHAGAFVMTQALRGRMSGCIDIDHHMAEALLIALAGRDLEHQGKAA